MSSLDEYTRKQVPARPEKKEDFKAELDALLKEHERLKQQMKEQPTVMDHPVMLEQQPEKKIMFAPEPTKPEEQKKHFHILTREEQKEIIRKQKEKMESKGKRLRRQEKKDLNNKEMDATSKTRTILIGLAVFCILFVGFIRPYLPNQALYTIILLMGMMLFFPLGMIAGWIFLDPIMRCKILRKTSKRNYGIIGFVGKGMKAVLKIKNFDEGLIWRDKACWVLTKDKIIQITKDANAINNEEKVIDPENVITLVDTVPMVFVDLDSMEPLLLHQKDREPVYPLEIGPTLKAWEDNQRAKIMALKKAQDILLYIAIIASIGAIVICFITMGKVDAVSKELSTVHNMLNNITINQMLSP